MDRILVEIEEIEKRIGNYQQGPVYHNEEIELDLLEVAAERLLAEIVYFKAKKTAKERTARIKIAAKFRSSKT